MSPLALVASHLFAQAPSDGFNENEEAPSVASSSRHHTDDPWIRPLQKVSVSVDVEVLIHDGESSEGGYWAEVPGIPGCFSQADTMDEMLANIKEAIELMLEPIPQAIRDEARRKGAAIAAKTSAPKSLKVRSKRKA